MRPRQFRLAIRLALVELLLSGCTTAADHHNLFAPGLENAIDIEVEEARTLRLRTTVTRGSMGFSEKDGGLQPDNLSSRRRDDPQATASACSSLFHDQRPGALIRSRARALLAARGATSRLFVDFGASSSEQYDGRLHCSPLPVAGGGRLLRCRRWACARSTFSRRPAGCRRAPGSPTPIHANPDDIGRLGHAGVGVAHLPAADMAFGVGICPTREWEAAGAPVGLGVDGSASNDSSNIMEAARHALMLQRLRYGARRRRAPTTRCAGRTQGGARCLGRDDIGRLAPGLPG